MHSEVTDSSLSWFPPFFALTEGQGRGTCCNPPAFSFGVCTRLAVLPTPWNRPPRPLLLPEKRPHWRDQGIPKCPPSLPAKSK